MLLLLSFKGKLPYPCALLHLNFFMHIQKCNHQVQWPLSQLLRCFNGVCLEFFSNYFHGKQCFIPELQFPSFNSNALMLLRSYLVLEIRIYFSYFALDLQLNNIRYIIVAIFLTPISRDFVICYNASIIQAFNYIIMQSCYSCCEIFSYDILISIPQDSKECKTHIYGVCHPHNVYI